MNKHIIAGAVLVLGLLITGTAYSATFADKYPRAAIHSVVEISAKEQLPVYKFTDGNTACYVMNAKLGPVISCVR